MTRSHRSRLRVAVLTAGLVVPATCLAGAQTLPQRPSGGVLVARQSTGAVSRPTAQRSSSAQTPQGREASIPRFRVDEHGALVPDLHAAAAVIYRPATGQVLWGVHAEEQRSVASLTKLMTAAIFLDTQPDLAQRVTIATADTRAASTTVLRAGDRVTVDDLLHLLLIASDNAAARAIARISPWGTSGFVARMNEKARELGLHQTRYADPSGLRPENVSSAFDLARLISHTAGHERLAAIMRKLEYRCSAGRRTLTVQSTNLLLRQPELAEVDIKGGKTGYIAAAGYCFATLLGLPQLNEEVAVVVLGARSHASRFLETRNMVDWLLANARELFSRGSQP